MKFHKNSHLRTNMAQNSTLKLKKMKMKIHSQVNLKTYGKSNCKMKKLSRAISRKLSRKLTRLRRLGNRNKLMKNLDKKSRNRKI